MSFIIFDIALFAILFVILLIDGLNHTCVIATPTKKIVVSKGDVPRLSPPQIAGFEFVGWFKDFSLTIPFDETKPVMHDITIYPKYLLIE